LPAVAAAKHAPPIRLSPSLESTVEAGLFSAPSSNPTSHEPLRRCTSGPGPNWLYSPQSGPWVSATYSFGGSITMAFRLPFPAPSTDGRMHREEDLTLARRASQRNARSTPLETPSSAGLKLHRSVEDSPTRFPVLQRRHIALPDPVAFRYVFPSLPGSCSFHC